MSVGEESVYAASYAAGVRLPYQQLPGLVQRWIEDQLGGPVVSVSNKRGGFSPGAAAAVETATGNRAFVKAVGGNVNPDSLRMYRDERDRTAGLPATRGLLKPTAAANLEVAGEPWTAILFPVIEGKPPRHPWQAADVARVLAELAELSDRLTPSPCPPSTELEQKLAAFFNGWERIAAEETAGWRADPWVLEQLPGLVELEVQLRDRLPGNTLSHTDLRADNLLLTDEQVWFVDWAHARNTAAWVDPAILLCDVIASKADISDGGDVDVPALLRGLNEVNAWSMVAALAGAMHAMSLQPAPPGLPTIRSWQAATGNTLLAFLKRRQFVAEAFLA